MFDYFFALVFLLKTAPQIQCSEKICSFSPRSSNLHSKILSIALNRYLGKKSSLATQILVPIKLCSPAISAEARPVCHHLMFISSALLRHHKTLTDFNLGMVFGSNFSPRVSAVNLSTNGVDGRDYLKPPRENTPLL